MQYAYDQENILARIIRGDLPSTRIAEGPHSLAIRDIRPQAPDHILILPKGPYVCFDHFMANADPAEIADFFALTAQVTRDLNLTPELGGGGYRLIANTGADGFQEIAHFHMHVLGGRWLGPLLPGATDVETAEQEFGPKLSNDILLNKER